MSDKRILFVNQEIAPYLPSNPLSDLGRNLPQAIHSKGCEVRTFMPRYGSVNERRNQLHEVIRLSGMNIIIDDNDHPLIIKVASMQPSRIQVYFIDNDDYFQKSEDDVDAYGSNRPDNDERAIFFARGTMETARKLRWEPTVIHCSGLITTLLPIYLRKVCTDEAAFGKSKIVYSVLPGEFTAPVDARLEAKLQADGVKEADLVRYADLPHDSSLMHILAIDHADGVIFHTPEPDPVLLERVKALGLPWMMAPENPADAAAYSEFYQSLGNEA